LVPTKFMARLKLLFFYKLTIKRIQCICALLSEPLEQRSVENAAVTALSCTVVNFGYYPEV